MALINTLFSFKSAEHTCATRFESNDMSTVYNYKHVTRLIKEADGKYITNQKHENMYIYKQHAVQDTVQALHIQCYCSKIIVYSKLHCVM